MTDCCSIHADQTAPGVLPCPVNGARSKRVDRLIVRSLARCLPLGMSDAPYYFCEAKDCDVVYFCASPQMPVFRRKDLLVRVGVKETEDPIPVCYCFGFTRKDIENEIIETGSSTIAGRIAGEVKSGNCACEVKNPSGKCCLGNVARVSQECLRTIRGTKADVAE